MLCINTIFLYLAAILTSAFSDAAHGSHYLSELVHLFHLRVPGSLFGLKRS